MDYPFQVSTFTVTGRLMYGDRDHDDTGIAPELTPVENARVVFTPDLDPAMYRVPAASMVVHQLPIEATTNAVGQLCGLVDGTPDVQLVYGFDPDISPTGWTWRVLVQVDGFPEREFSITGSAGGIVDLGSVVPVPPDPGGDISEWDAVVGQATSARDAAVAAANSVAPGQPNGTASLDGAGKLPEQQVPARLAETALNLLIDAALARYPELDGDDLIPLAFLPLLNPARIPDLDAAKVTSGVFGVDRIPALKETVPWAALTLAAGFTGAIRYRVLAGRLVHVDVQVTGSIPVGTTALTTDAIPAAYRPPAGSNARGGCYFTSGYSGVAYALTDGTVGVGQQTGGARTGTSASILYTI